jgi:hypothetical protein
MWHHDGIALLAKNHPQHPLVQLHLPFHISPYLVFLLTQRKAIRNPSPRGVWMLVQENAVSLLHERELVTAGDAEVVPITRDTECPELFYILCGIPRPVSQQLLALWDVMPYLTSKESFELFRQFLHRWQSRVLGRKVKTLETVFGILRLGYDQMWKTIQNEIDMPYTLFKLHPEQDSNHQMIWERIRSMIDKFDIDTNSPYPFSFGFCASR